MLRNMLKIFHPPNNLNLGRWQLKHDAKKCEDYIIKYYAEPGYIKNKQLELIYKNKIKEQKKE